MADFYLPAFQMDKDGDDIEAKGAYPFPVLLEKGQR
jgi:hypothetical protein